MVRINCSAIPEHLMESELFGYERGAFAGAMKTKKGLIELAAGGTVFLDEIGELPLSMQTKILTFLDHKKFKRVGGLEDKMCIRDRISGATLSKAVKVDDDLKVTVTYYPVVWLEAPEEAGWSASNHMKAVWKKVCLLYTSGGHGGRGGRRDIHRNRHKCEPAEQLLQRRHELSGNGDTGRYGKSSSWHERGREDHSRQFRRCISDSGQRADAWKQSVCEEEFRLRKIRQQQRPGRLRGGPGAVSYTHLDVYKRQIPVFFFRM